MRSLKNTFLFCFLTNFFLISFSYSGQGVNNNNSCFEFLKKKYSGESSKFVLEKIERQKFEEMVGANKKKIASPPKDLKFDEYIQYADFTGKIQFLSDVDGSNVSSNIYNARDFKIKGPKEYRFQSKFDKGVASKIDKILNLCVPPLEKDILVVYYFKYGSDLIRLPNPNNKEEIKDFNKQSFNFNSINSVEIFFSLEKIEKVVEPSRFKSLLSIFTSRNRDSKNCGPNNSQTYSHLVPDINDEQKQAVFDDEKKSNNARLKRKCLDDYIYYAQAEANDQGSAMDYVY